MSKVAMVLGVLGLLAGGGAATYVAVQQGSAASETAGLKKQVQDLDDSVARQKRNQDDLTQRLTVAQNDGADAKKELSNVQRELSAVKAELAASKSELTTARKDLTDTLLLTATLKAELAATKDQVKEVRQQPLPSRDEIARIRQDLSDLKRELGTIPRNELGVSKEAFDRVRSELKDAIEETAKTVSATDAKVKAANDAFEARTKALAADIEAARKGQNSDAQIADLAKKVAGIEEKSNSLSADLQALRGSKDPEGAKQLSELSRKIGEVEEKTKALSADVQALRESKDPEAAQKLADLAKKIEALAAEIQALRGTQDPAAAQKLADLAARVDSLGEGVQKQNAGLEARLTAIEKLAQESPEKVTPMTPEEREELKKRQELERQREQELAFKRQQADRLANVPLDFAARAGGHYTNKLLRDPLGNLRLADVLDESDAGFQGEVDLGYRIFQFDFMKFWIRDRFTETAWAKHEAFNVGVNNSSFRVRLGMPQDQFWGEQETGVAYYWVSADPYAQVFSTETTAGTTMGWFGGQASFRYARNQYKVNDPDFADRDAEVFAGTVKTSFRIEEAYTGKPVLFAIGATREHQKTQGSEFDRRLTKFFATVQVELELNTRWNLELAWSDADYLNAFLEDPSGRVRHDKIATAALEAFLPIDRTRRYGLQGRFEYQNRRSNIEPFDFDAYIATLGMELEF